MAVVLALIFASGAWFSPMYARRDVPGLIVAMVGSFVLLFIAIRDYAFSPMHAAFAAGTTTAMLAASTAIMGTQLRKKLDSEHAASSGREDERAGRGASCKGRRPDSN
jgi:type IV secretory pathway VirB6-like protein